MMSRKKDKKISQKEQSQGKELPKKAGENQSAKAAHTGDKQIRFLIWLFSGIFLLLAGYLGYFMTVQKNTVINNPYNTTRQSVLAAKNVRGPIKTEEGDILAYTDYDEDGNEIRIYPYRNLFAHTVGYTSRGRMGIESIANFELMTSHENLADQIQNDLNNEKDMGDSVITTLDLELQKAAYQSLSAYQGTIIVMEPSTGKILAMVSTPDFDPNEIDTIWDSLVEDEDSSVLVNRATQGLYPPGSTFKILTALEYIRENPETYQDYSFNCNGRYTAEDGTTIHCYNHGAHGTVSFASSFAYSCNSSFANIGMSLNRNAFSQTLENMLFNTRLPGVFTCSRSTITMNESVSEYDMMQTAIGQGETLITPMHLSLITCAIANGGTLMEPYLISSIESCDGDIVKKYAPTAYGQLMTQQEAEILTQMMTEVCDYGTARKFNGESYTVAGKTGSAEYESGEEGNGNMESHAWFTGFAPAENPEIVVTVIIEGAGSGGDYAVPMAKRVFLAYFNGKEQQENP